MDRIAESGKKVPLLVIGDLPAVLPGAAALAISAIARPDINEYYVILAVSSGSLEPSLETLTAANFLPDQLLIYLQGEPLPRHPKWSSAGVIEPHENESAEELRARLFIRLEAQRQKKLVTALRDAHDGGIARRLTDSELMRTLDVARLAHALAAAYGLPPSAHTRVLRSCLETCGAPARPWSGEPAPEQLVPEAAVILVDAFLQGLSCREVIREHAAGMSFRARNDLAHQVDACLGTLLGGKHAA